MWALLRISMGWIFFWPFLDKVFGLGFSTVPDKAWLQGNSPTTGFLQFATQGPFADFFHGLAGSPFVDWLFMVGLFGIGLALLLGVAVRFAALMGIVMLVLMYAAVWPPEHNPFLDDHLVYSIVLLGLAFVNAGSWFGLGAWWGRAPIVRAMPFLK